MSDLQNPLFDEEKEFLEHKKLEYERALRGDVDHIKEQSAKVGKVALVGAGLAGGIWLITKAFGGKKKKRNRYAKPEDDFAENGYNGDEFENEDFEGEDEFGAEYYTAGNGKRYRSVRYQKSAADSARAFMEQDQPEHGREADDLGLGSKAAPRPEEVEESKAGASSYEQAYDSSFDPEEFEDDPFKDLPYDDSRRLPASHAFDEASDRPSQYTNARPKNNMVASVLQAFLKSDTGKVLVAQAAAVVLAMVTKK
ncbi:hypothetical protein ACFQT0_03205 [Hymenobacter humi]|uniref:Uncharacterized protein n=1 Tax=Hymenobacter humi TaxID=1411620 RepID=A0ABW2TZJ1_9BACT